MLVFKKGSVSGWDTFYPESLRARCFSQVAQHTSTMDTGEGEAGFCVARRHIDRIFNLRRLLEDRFAFQRSRISGIPRLSRRLRIQRQNYTTTLSIKEWRIWKVRVGHQRIVVIPLRNMASFHCHSAYHVKCNKTVLWLSVRWVVMKRQLDIRQVV